MSLQHLISYYFVAEQQRNLHSSYSNLQSSGKNHIMFIYLRCCTMEYNGSANNINAHTVFICNKVIIIYFKIVTARQHALMQPGVCQFLLCAATYSNLIYFVYVR